MRVGQKLDAIGTLASGIAHDFNNALTGIVGNTELALSVIAPEHPAAELLGESLGVGLHLGQFGHRGFSLVLIVVRAADR